MLFFGMCITMPVFIFYIPMLFLRSCISMLPVCRPISMLSFMQPSLYAIGHVMISLCHGSCYWVTALWVNRIVTMLWDSGGPKLPQNLRGAAQAACVL